MSKETAPLHSLVGTRVGTHGGIEGMVTAVREPTPMPALVGGKVWCLPPYIEIDGFVQVHPSMVKKVDKEE